MKKSYLFASLILSMVSLSSCNQPPKITKIELDKTETSCFEGQKITLNSYVTMSDNSEYLGDVVWTTSDEAIASVVDGLITTYTEGTVNITASAESYSATCKVNVLKDNVNSITLSNTNVTLDAKYATYKLEASALHESGKNYDGNFTFTSSDSNIASVTPNGLITALNHGTTTITVSVGTAQATCEVNVDLSKEVAVILEAEDYASNSKLIRYNPLYSNGAYVGGIDDCGNGIKFRYFAYTTGTRTIEINYSTANTNPFMHLHVNGEFVTKVIFDTNTGWGTDGILNRATISVDVPTTAGWNDIDLIKEGTEQDNPQWGGNVELDYIKILPLSTPIDPNFYYEQEVLIIDAEHAEAYTNANPPATTSSTNARLSRFVGGIDNDGQGITARTYLKEGTYQLVLNTGGNDLGNKVATINTNENEEMNAKLPLSTTNSWDNFQESTSYVELTIENEGYKEIKITKQNDSVWFTIDYIKLTKVA